MSSSLWSSQAAAQSSHKKRPRSGHVPLAPPAPRGQNRIYGLKAVSKDGKSRYKKHTKSSYFFGVCVYRDSLLCKFPKIVKWM